MTDEVPRTERNEGAGRREGAAPALITVLGIGNTLMGDDGVGTHIADLLAECDLGENVRVVSGGVAGMALVPHFVESDAVVIIDAISLDDEPGSVYRFTPEQGKLPMRSQTSHGFTLPAVLMAAQLQGSSPEVVIYGVQIGDITCGFDTLSPEVDAAVPDVLEMVTKEAARLAAGT